MAQRENQRVQASKRLMKEGLLKMLETESLDRINVSTLCKVAGINRATFYRHYTCPRDVLVDMEMDMVRDVSKNLKMPVSQQEAKQYLEDVCAYLYEHKELVRILIRSKTDEDLAGILEEFNKKTWHLREEVEEIRHLDQESLSLVATFMYTGCYYLIRQWLTEGINKTPKEVAELIYSLITHGRQIFK